MGGKKRENRNKESLERNNGGKITESLEEKKDWKNRKIGKKKERKKDSKGRNKKEKKSLEE